MKNKQFILNVDTLHPSIKRGEILVYNEKGYFMKDYKPDGSFGMTIEPQWLAMQIIIANSLLPLESVADC